MMTNESHNLHELMIRVIAHRKAVLASPPPMSALISALGDLQHGLEGTMNTSQTREAALDLACIAFRVAAELQSPGLPVAAPTSELLRAAIPSRD
jgi:hypothetical protein